MPHPLITATLSLLLAVTLLPAQTQSPPVPALADIHSQSELEATIRSLDTALFTAYNTCNLPAFSALVADDVEFPHDQGGLTLGNAVPTESIPKSNLVPFSSYKPLPYTPHRVASPEGTSVPRHRRPTFSASDL